MVCESRLQRWRFCSPASFCAADTPLTLHGRVLDENGQPVAGVQVILEGLGKPKISALTDGAGYFSVPNLAPGEYTVQMEKVDFFVLRGQTIQLAAGATEFSFTLNHIQEVREKVDVVADPNRIEPTETPQSATLTSTEFFYIPVPSAHDYQQSLIALPQIVRDNQALLHIAGARATQSQYLMDGFEVGDPVSGALTIPIIVDALRTAEVETGRFGAEFAAPRCVDPQVRDARRRRPLALQRHGFCSRHQRAARCAVRKLLSAHHVFRSAGGGKALVPAIVQPGPHAEHRARHFHRATTPASSGAATLFRACCGTWRRTTACISLFSTTTKATPAWDSIRCIRNRPQWTLPATGSSLRSKTSCGGITRCSKWASPKTASTAISIRRATGLICCW